MAGKFRRVKPRSTTISSIRMGDFYTVASVELGNTTSKCILVSTNLNTAEIFEIEKEVKFTRNVRAPYDGEKTFGRTLVGVDLTRDSVKEFISELLKSVTKKARIRLDRDLHFVVRSTGVTAGFAKPEEVGEMVKALAQGCVDAGVPTNRMTAVLSPDNLPPGIRDFTWLKKVYFDGAVASCLPPSEGSVVANEMEGELVTAGLKGAAKSCDIDFRNPVLTLDFGTTLAGRATDDRYPYAKTIGSFAGLAGAIPDSLARVVPSVDPHRGCVLDLPSTTPEKYAEIEQDAEEVHELITVEVVPEGVERYGTVPVNPTAARQSDVVLIGVDVGVNGSQLDELSGIGEGAMDKNGISALMALVDATQVWLVQRLVEVAEANNLILPDTSLGVTGRAIVTEMKPNLLADTLQLADGKLWIENHDLLVVDDGLALGAAVAARCMNSMGTKHNPMGGRKGDACIMGARMKLQKDCKESQDPSKNSFQ
ncbi:MAG: methanogenesis marker 14 protein [Promethearchaeia archaeon]